jgi:F-type H+-transporting ATPase subunit epsilon
LPVELTIVTPERQVFSGPVDNVVLPGSEGDFGVLENHERFLAPLRIGEAHVQVGGSTRYAAISDGFAQVNAERVVVLVDSCELADEIDVARANAAKERAERRIRELASGHEDDVQTHLSESALQRAVIRIQVSGRK